MTSQVSKLSKSSKSSKPSKWQLKMTSDVVLEKLLNDHLVKEQSFDTASNGASNSGLEKLLFDCLIVKEEKTKFLREIKEIKEKMENNKFLEQTDKLSREMCEKILCDDE